MDRDINKSREREREGRETGLPSERQGESGCRFLAAPSKAYKLQLLKLSLQRATYPMVTFAHVNLVRNTPRAHPREEVELARQLGGRLRA